MPTLVAVALGGAVGASARYGVGKAVAAGLGAGTIGPFTPLATFLVNIAGAFALGLLFGLTEERLSMDPTLRTALAVGVLGSFTTFSTLMYELVEQLEDGATLAAGASLAGSIGFGLAAVAVGLAIGRHAT